MLCRSANGASVREWTQGIALHRLVQSVQDGCTPLYIVISVSLPLLIRCDGHSLNAAHYKTTSRLNPLVLHFITMPSLRNWQLLRALLFTKLAAPGEEAQTHLYDDPAFNEKLGIKRHGDTYDHDDAPLQFQGNDMTSFTSYVSAAINASEEQLKSKWSIQHQRVYFA
jgi:hypothetical protein